MEKEYEDFFQAHGKLPAAKDLYNQGASYADIANAMGLKTNINNAIEEQRLLAEKKLTPQTTETKTEAFSDPSAGALAKEASSESNKLQSQANTATTQDQEARSRQQAFIAELQQQAAGTANTAAQKALREADARSQARQRAIAASAPQVSAANLRGQQRQQVQSQQQLQDQSNTLRVQEQLEARQKLANALQSQSSQDLGMQLTAEQSGMQLQDIDQAAGLAQTNAQTLAEQLAVEQRLAEQGARLTGDIANMQASAAQREGTQALLGTAGGLALAGPLGIGLGAGAALGGSLLPQLFNKGGTVDAKQTKKAKPDKKMSKDEKFGFKKALESAQSNDNNYSYGGPVSEDPLYGGLVRDANTGEIIDMTPRSSKAEFNIQNVNQMRETSRQRRGQQRQAAETSRQQREQTTGAQNALQFDALQSAQGAGPSLVGAQLRQAGDKSLQQQLAAAQSSKRPIQQDQLQRALQNAQAQEANAIAQQAAQLAAQEQSAGSQLGLAIGQGQRQLSAQENQALQNLANQQLSKQLGLEQQIQQGLAGQERLRLDELAALQALEAQRNAASQASNSGGLLSSIFNQGGTVPGKPAVKGDSPKNDTVPAMLSPGEIVIPRTVVDKGEKAMHGFIKGLQEMQKGKKMSCGGKVSKMNKGGSVQDSDKNKKPKKDSKFAQTAAAAAQGALGVLGDVERQKQRIQQQRANQAASDFATALSRIRSQTARYNKGGYVTSPSYGSILEAKRELDNYKKTRNNKKGN